MLLDLASLLLIQVDDNANRQQAKGKNCLKTERYKYDSFHSLPPSIDGTVKEIKDLAWFLCSRKVENSIMLINVRSYEPLLLEK